MAIVRSPDSLFSTSIRKRFTVPAGFGNAVFAYTSFGSDYTYHESTPFGAALFGSMKFGNMLLLSGIYAQRACVGGRRSVRLKFYQPLNPQSVPQQANRGKLADGVVAWKDLTAEQKRVYNLRASGRGMSGYNLFLHDYMLS